MSSPAAPEQFIDVKRRFRRLTDKELEDIDTLLPLGDLDLGSDFRWPGNLDWADLLKCARIVVLAEAGAGKTREMREQANRLVQEGKFAFFVPLEALGKEKLPEVLSPTEETMLEAWQASEGAVAWFFLDAVDELKLAKESLPDALRHLSKTIHRSLDRARILISCRPSDWRSYSDGEAIQHGLPMTKRRREALPEPSDDYFLSVLNGEYAQSTLSAEDQASPSSEMEFQTVAMLPLSDKQIGLFVRQAGVEKPAELVEELHLQQAWPFARRPLDLVNLIVHWRQNGRLGTRVEQQDTNIRAKLGDGPERLDSGVLNDLKARQGAECLALGLALTRTRTVLSPDLVSETDTGSVLDASAILPGWTQEERNALLRRGLFDPATHGRVRFHHRSVQEYMAACRLRALREQGMSTRSLFRLLFSQRYGVQVVFPSMRPIAAWLALWDDNVRQEMLDREPETLLSFGSPGMLDLATRRAIVEGIGDKHGARGSLRLNASIESVRQLANPSLGPTIRGCWRDDIVNSDVGRFLLHLIQFGPVKDCADLARTAALSEVVDPYNRAIAIRALITCGEGQAVRNIVGTMLSSVSSWSDRVVRIAIVDLFPRFMSVNELVSLVERTPEAKHTVGGLEWTLQAMARGIDALSREFVVLRNGLADLVWRKRQGTQVYDLHSSVHHVIPALSVLCMKHLEATPNNLDGELVRACVIASRFGKHTLGGGGMEVGKLKSAFPLQSKAREDAFWIELEILDEVSAEAIDWKRLHDMQSGLIGHLLEDDRPWLEKALSCGNHHRRRRIALHALLDLWRQARRPESKLASIRECLEDDEALVQALEREIAPLEESNELIRMKRETRNRRAGAQHREEQRLTEWRTWRDNVRSDPDGAFSSERVDQTLHNFYKWLRVMSQNSSTSLRVWNRGALADAFGERIADLAERAFRDFWRQTMPLPSSQRPFGERNTTPGSWVMSLEGIYAEASRDGWTDSLSSDEAHRAAIYATLEINGFAPFITSLANSHPKEVEEVLGGEISFELHLDDGGDHLSSLQNLRLADNSVKNLLAPRLVQEMRSWPSLFTDDTELRQAKRLDQLIGVLSKTEDAAERETITKICGCRYKVDPFCPSALAWLKGLFRFDAAQGVRALVDSFKRPDDTGRQEQMVETFAHLFNCDDGVPLAIDSADDRAAALEELVRLAFTIVRPEEDLTHDSVYTPNDRDKAQDARRSLLESLLAIPGRRAYQAILTLAGEKKFEDHADWLRHKAEERAALDAEFEAWKPEGIVVLENQLEAPPRDRDSLFTVMMDRLDDLAHDLAHHDFSDRNTLASIDSEAEMQRTLALRLRDRAKRAYDVTREEEVADAKRTDIRLSTVAGGHKAAIEVKMADKWSLSQLKAALHDQLVGQYMRHISCRAGCLLLVHSDPKRYWVSGGRLNFSEIVENLKEEAKAIASEKDLLVSAFGLDLTGGT